MAFLDMYRGFLNFDVIFAVTPTLRMCEERLLGEAEVEDAADLGLDCLEPGGELRQLGEWLRGDEGVPGVIVTQQPVTPHLYST